MSASPTKLQRWLDVVAHLAGRRLPVSTEDLWRAVPAYANGLYGSEKEKQTVRRMFERDKDELRQLGIPIEAVTYSINYGLEQLDGYQLRTKDFHLPYVRLVAEARREEEEDGRAGGASPDALEIGQDEAGAALDGLSELASVPSFPLQGAARSAFRKLAFDLDPEFLGQPAPVLYARDPEAEASADALRLLSDAVQRRKSVRFRYRGLTRDTESERRVHPFGLLFQHGRWYLVGRDADQDAERMFRLGRMSSVRLETPSGEAAEYEVPGSFDLETYAGRAAWEVGADGDGAVDAVVRFAFPRSLWAERNGHGELEREEADGSQLRRFRVLRRDPFLRWVLSLAGDARVEAPPDLRDGFTALVTAVRNRYEGEGAR